MDPHRVRSALAPAGVNHTTMMFLGYTVDGMVDASLVYEALCRVIRRWPLLAGRIERGGETGYEVVVPAPEEVTDEDVLFTTLESDETCPFALPALPGPSYSLTPSVTAKDRMALFAPLSSAPINLVDYLEAPPSIFQRLFAFVRRQKPPSIKPASPLLYLHVGNYRDRSLVGLSVPHAIFDGSGAGLVIKELESAMLLGEKYEALDLIETAPGNPLRALKDALLDEDDSYETQGKYGEPPGMRVLDFAEKVAKANALLKAEDASGASWISTGDFLAAFLWKTALAASSPTSRLATSFIQASDPRPRLGKLLPSHWAGSVVAHLVAPSGASAAPSIATVLATPLHELAALIRKSINHMATGTRIARAMQWRLKMVEEGHNPVPVLTGKLHFVAASNRIKTGMGTCDFSPAMRSGTGNVLDAFCTGPLQPLLLDSFAINQSPDKENGHGLFVVEGAMRQRSWVEVERLLSAMAEELH